MRRIATVGLVLLPIGAIACVDLFHDTDFAFVADAAASGGDGGERDGAVDAQGPSDAAPLDFCALSIDEARPIAHRACALLAACETPVGTNAVGRCLERALPVIACQGAPDRAARGAVLAHYQCLAAARTCEDIARCVLGDAGAPSCGANVPFTQCVGDVRLDCRKTGQPAGAESCAATGRVCARDGLGARCVGPDGLGGCARTTCDGSKLRICADAGDDLGFDCADFGAGNCAAPAKPGKGTPGCVPTSKDTCIPGSSIRCSGRVAIGCATGVEDRLDCQGLFGTSCTDITTDAPPEIGWDVSRACEVRPDGGRCSKDSCSGTTLYACVHGNATALDCAALVGGTCGKVTTSDGVDVATCVVP